MGGKIELSADEAAYVVAVTLVFCAMIGVCAGAFYSLTAAIIGGIAGAAFAAFMLRGLRRMIIIRR